MTARRAHDDFERLYAEHARALLRFFVYRTGDRALSEDLLADTFERVLTTRRRFDRRKASEKTWLYAIALNRLRDHARHEATGDRARERAAAGAQLGSGASAFDAIEQRDELERALAGLSIEEREAIGLRFGADLTVPEIAKLTGAKLTTIEGRVYRALRKLKHALDPDDEL
jgi:RNA polymerase sigma-70 factor (ECF subfamily)